MLSYTMHATKLCSFLVVLSCLTAAAVASCSTSSYYVVALDGDPCPNSLSTCRELSYYTSRQMFTDNTVFCFLKGHHILDLEGFVTINGVSNLTWQGIGAMKMGPHETTMQSTVVIKCNRSTGGFMIRDSQFVTILNMTLTDCAAPISYHYHYPYPDPYFSAVGLYLIYLQNTYLRYISIHNASGIGLHALGCFNLTIEDSSFFYNQFPVDKLPVDPVGAENAFGANMAIFMYSELSLHSNTSNKLSIVRSNFSFSLGEQFTSGSGLSIFLGESKHDVLIDNVVAYNNSGMSNINIICSGASHFTINNTRSLYGTVIAHNTGGAGLFFGQENNNATEAKLFVYNSDFSHNCAGFGAGMFIIWFTSSAGKVVVDNCTFYNNTGNFSSALYVSVSLSAKIYYQGNVNPKFTFVNGTFHGNKHFEWHNSSVQSTITVQNVADIEFDSINVFNNPTTGLIAYSSNIVFRGNNTFTNNSGVDGGGMALYGLSYIVLSGPALVNFTANNASHNGGGLYINQPFEPVFSLCFFQKTYPVNVDARIVLSKNTAGMAGSALYGGNQIESCLSYGTNFSSLFLFPDQLRPNDISSDPDKVCLCNNGTVDCSNFTYSTSAVPGKQFSVTVSAVGNMNGSSEGTIIVNFTNNNASTLVSTLAECKSLSYELEVADNQTKEVQVTLLLQRFLASPLTPPQRITANIKVLTCPEGFQLNLKSKICDCSDHIVSMNLGISCDIATETVKKKMGMYG